MTIRIDEDLLKALKMHCVEHEITMTEAIKTAIESLLAGGKGPLDNIQNPVIKEILKDLIKRDKREAAGKV